MKKSHKILILIAITTIIALTVLGIYLVNYQGLTLYFLLVSGEHSGGYREAESFKELTTDDLIEIIKRNEDWNKHREGTVTRHFKYGRYEGAIKVLGSKPDGKALDKLTEIIYTYPEGQKWTAIGSIGRHKNKAMLPVLCEALKRHTYWHTDDLIVDALVNIDDPAALDCLLPEKDKLRLFPLPRARLEEAIARWSKNRF